MFMKTAMAALLLLGLASPVAAQAAPDGERLFRQRCASCHSLEGKSGAGPALDGVSGRTAGTVEGFNYSQALRDSGIVWDAATLDQFLTNPSALVRGTRMSVRLPREADRAAIIGFMTGN